ncbi:LysR substrate-binding domain-containing protein [Crenobacter intestini]|uniref:LysR family transcriptional regulator n=1 Tax=Crenobacter intestini TaxID=2563443 RepID=A0A4T0V5R4_9NEIS|nr:LysR substrate-binding domain-containing protein [Crenobacter intestini]TIC87012.1 LysR family transcriptional regulator [Crenobacter intestini]
MDTKWLLDFVALAEERHFSRAAARRHVTQPAFGRRIQALEAAVGTPLVERGTSPVTLTGAGRQFHALARGLLAQLDEGLELVRGEENALETPIRVAAPHALASRLLLDLLQAGAGGCRTAVEVMRVDEAAEALLDGRIDFVLGFDVMALMAPPYRHLALGDGHFLLVSAPGSAGKPCFDPRVSSVPYLRYSADAYGARLIARHNADAGLQLAPVFETSMCQLLAEMALRGQGVAWLPDALIEHELAAGRLAAVAPGILRIPYQVRLYRSPARQGEAAERMWASLEARLAGNWRLLAPWRAQLADADPA